MTADPIRDHFAARLDHLMRTVQRPDGRTWTNSEMSRALSEVGVAASEGYIAQLREGRKTNPAASYVGALAQVLGVPVVYFYARDTGELDRELAAGTLTDDDSAGRPTTAAEAIAAVERSYRLIQGLPTNPESNGHGPSR